MSLHVSSRKQMALLPHLHHGISANVAQAASRARLGSQTTPAQQDMRRVRRPENVAKAKSLPQVPCGESEEVAARAPRA